MKKLILICALFAFVVWAIYAYSDPFDMSMDIGFKDDASGIPSGDSLFLETGDYILLEDGSYFLLE